MAQGRHGRPPQQNASVKSVRAVSDSTSNGAAAGSGSPQQTGVPKVTPSSQKSGNFLVRAKDALHSGRVGLSNVFKRAAHSAKASRFGLNPVVGTIKGVVNKTASGLHVSKPVAAVALSTVMLFGAGGIAVGIANTQKTDFFVKQQDYYDSCVDDYQLALSSGIVQTGGVADVEGQMLENAKKLWALGQAMGFTDEQCAGMLGCLQAESGNFDPTSVETIYDEPFQIGPRKSVLFVADTDATPGGVPNSAMDIFVPGEMKAKYDRSGISINLPAYMDDAKQHYCAGIGVVAWTGPTAFRLCRYAHEKGMNWYDFNLQCANMIVNDKTRLDGFVSWTAGQNSVEEATAAWFGWMERGLGAPTKTGNFERRFTYAKEWYARFSPISGSIVNEFGTFGNDVMSLAETSVNYAGSKHAMAAREECGEENTSEIPTPDNSSLAAAAVAYAWETTSMGIGNNGTELFQAVHDAMYPGDEYYMSCDRGVACAVCWSGADDDFPAGATGNQVSYMKLHPEMWEPLGDLNGCVNDLQPGDILITHVDGHVLMYVGNETVIEKYPSSKATTVSASFGERSPGCGSNMNDGANGCSWFLDGGGDGRHYIVFRYIGDYSGSKKDRYVGNASGTS